jgi:tRNA (cytidine/uridine-2'-O-)-methyltransferase
LRLGETLHVVLHEPEIPHNAGAAGRLCLATGSLLHLVGRLGFSLDDAHVRRTGLDYWRHVDLRRHDDWEGLAREVPRDRWRFFTTKAERLYHEADYPPDAALIFGRETRGLPESCLADPERCFRIPIFDSRVRSLNLSTAVAIVLYEALRQQGFPASQSGGGPQRQG